MEHLYIITTNSSLAVVILINAVIAVLTLVKSPKNPINRAFFIFVVLVDIWVTIRLIDDITFQNYPSKIFWAQMAIAAPILIPFFFYRFVKIFLNTWNSTKLWMKILAFVPALLLLPFVFSKYNLDTYYFDGNIGRFRPGPLYIWFTIYFMLLVGYALVLLFRQKKQFNKIKQRQIIYIFWGAFLTAFTGILFSSILPLFGFDTLYYLGSSSSILFSGLVFYAIIKHRFFDLGVLLKRIYVNFLSAVPGLILFFVLFYILKSVVGINSQFEFFSYVLLILVILLSFKYFHYLILKWLGPIEADPNLTIKALCNLITASGGLQEFADSLKAEIIKNTNSIDVRLFIAKEGGNKYQLVDQGDNRLTLVDGKSEVLEYLKHHDELLNLEEAKYLGVDKKVIEEMSGYVMDLAMPMFHDGNLIAVMIVDKDGQLFTDSEYKFLKNLKKEITFCLHNLLLYEQSLARIKERS